MIRISDALARAQAKKKNDEGFSLIELLVVVIIIGILAAIAIPIYIGVQNNAKDSAVKTDVSNAKTAVVAYYTDNGAYPTTLAGLDDYGYTVPPNANYGTAGTGKPSVTYVANDGGFCIAATAVTTSTFAASDTTGVAAGTCNAGVFSGSVTSP